MITRFPQPVVSRLFVLVTLLALGACRGDDANAPRSNDYPLSARVLEISIGNAQVMEGDGGTVTMRFPLSLSGASADEVSVDYVTSPDNAEPGSDYIHAKGHMVFLPGVTAANIDVLVLGDELDEHKERFLLLLADAQGATLGASSAVGTITDNDGHPSLQIQDAEVTEGNSGLAKLIFPVTLNVASGRTVWVDYSTIDVTAQAPGDYGSTTGQITFSPGETRRSVAIVIVGDTDPEGDETLEVHLQTANNASIPDGVASGTIIDDDTSGLPERPSNLTCLAPDAPTSSASIADERVYQSVPDFEFAVALLQAPGDNTQWYVAEQSGLVHRFDNVTSPSGASVFIDISSRVNSSFGEAGLLGVAFHPDYANNRFVYLSYTATGPNGSIPLTSRLSRFVSNDGGLTLDPSSEVILLSLDQPDDAHNGGHIVFGPDGYLYMGFGDGGGNPLISGLRSQNTLNLFGSVLRLDVDGGAPYAIPADNPFAGNPLCNISVGGGDAAADCPEIYAWGFRNPWRFSFDRATGKLWLGDVGQNSYEEVNIVEIGGNYGWHVQEGTACFNPATGCNTTGLVQPVITYDHGIGASITGGFVYRGTEIPELIGRYIFVDFVTKAIFASTSDGEGNYGYEVLYNSVLSLPSIAEDQAGELFGLRYGNGRIHKFIQAGGTANNTIPNQLADTGCFDPADVTLPASGLIPYKTAATLWSDGAAKERYYAIPDANTVDVDANGDWQFPVGSVLVKNFRLNDALIETRLFMRHTNGEWGGYTYEWDDTETGATRVIGGKSKVIDGQTWIYPSETQCMACHTDVAGSTLSVEHAQLNSSILYPATGLSGHQLITASAIGVLTDPLPDVPANLPALVDPADVTKPVEQRVRSYLHVNCSGCHRPHGPTPSSMDLRFKTPVSETNTCDVVPGSASLGLVDPRIIAPGDASRSVLVNRMNRRDVHGMPPLASSLVDTDGVILVSTWIDGLTACP